ncbi:hypothetical protein [Apilactobacillus ozensis]|uniref:hypothetical protein n=1 Tax=Apilactobacillus ozensis TaxID=866801 RepID=UPI0006D1DE6C|nr:hypothetical protein [Apilactobacillus ozensis]
MATVSIGTLSASADSSSNDINYQTFNTSDNGSLPIKNNVSEEQIVSGNQFLNNLKSNNPSIYAKMDQNTINEIKKIFQMLLVFLFKIQIQSNLVYKVVLMLKFIRAHTQFILTQQ